MFSEEIPLNYSIKSQKNQFVSSLPRDSKNLAPCTGRGIQLRDGVVVTRDALRAARVNKWVGYLFFFFIVVTNGNELIN